MKNDIFIKNDLYTSVYGSLEMVSEIFLPDEDEIEYKIGELNIEIFELGWLDSDVYIHADSASGEFIETLLGFNLVEHPISIEKYDEEKVDIFGKIAYINLIEIDKQYRGNGIGSIVMDETLTILEKMGVNFIILLSGSLEQLENDAEANFYDNKLLNFYKNLGFELSGKNNEYNILFKEL